MKTKEIIDLDISVRTMNIIKNKLKIDMKSEVSVLKKYLIEHCGGTSLQAITPFLLLFEGIGKTTMVSIASIFETDGTSELERKNLITNNMLNLNKNLMIELCKETTNVTEVLRLTSLLNKSSKHLLNEL